MTLAESDELVNQSELAERAGVSARSLRDHLLDLIDAEIVEKTEAGYNCHSRRRTETTGSSPNGIVISIQNG